MQSTLAAPELRRLRENLASARERIRAAEGRSGRPEGSCQLLPVVKDAPDPILKALLDEGFRDLAENRVQALRRRPAHLLASARVHLIGHLQTNKVRSAVAGFATFHALHSMRLAELASREARSLGRRWPVYLQVNLSGEQSKHGCAWDEAPELAARASQLEGLLVLGLMTMAPYSEAPESARPVFRGLAELGRALRERGALAPESCGLSMGMSQDFEVAVEEGATCVRLGTVLLDRVVEPPSDPG